MLDLNWETINGDVAHQIELTNAANQANVLTCLIQFLIAHSVPNCSPPPPDESALLMLHNAGTLLLLANPGTYRNIDVEVRNRKGELSLKPMCWQSVDGAMKTFFRNLYSLWQSGDPLDVAAYALWGVNFVHPFRNGNGRTARAFSYACLCIKQGAEPPGTPNVVNLMQQEPYKSQYEDFLASADKTQTRKWHPDLGPIRLFILDLLNIQLENVPRTFPPLPSAAPS